MLLNNQHKESTRINYHKIWGYFNQFTLKPDRKMTSWEESTSLYCTYLINKGAQSATIKSYVSAIKTKLRTDGYHWNEETFMFNALTRACKIKNDVVQDRRPIRKNLLTCILYQTDETIQEKYVKIMFLSAFQNAYYGMLRVSKYTAGPHAVKAKDVHITANKKHLKLVLHTSKTHGKGKVPQIIEIQSKKIGRYDPVLQTHQYAQLRSPYNDDNEPFYIYKDGTPLTARAVRGVLKDTIALLDLDPDFYDTHSFRVGRATDLNKTGWSLETIKQKGRWKSNAVFKYLRD